MSIRTSLALVVLPNQPFVLGTFDAERFRTWWRSNPFPDTLERIEKGIHIYGRTYLAIARRVDGRWAIYRSINYGIDWALAWLAAEGEVIYDIVLIKYGWAIVNTSDGFYESVKAGAAGSWAEITSLPIAPNAPSFCNLGGGDILMCTDGRYIWRSTDKARTWTLVCDQSTLTGRHQYKSSGTVTVSPGFAWSGTPRYAAIAGANGEVLCAYGPWMSISIDNGLTFDVHEAWDQYTLGYERAAEDGGAYYPPRSIVYDRFPSIATGHPNFCIKQIVVASVGGGEVENVKYLIRADDIYPAPGESALYVRVFSGHHGQYWSQGHSIWVDDMSPTIHPKFQQFISPDESLNQISAYEMPITGESGTNRLAFSAQTALDANGNPIPSLKFSTDGGQTWQDLDVTKLKVVDENNLPTSGGPFLDDSYASSAWVQGPCDNYGHWVFSEGKRAQCISYEMDTLLGGMGEKNQFMDVTLEADIPVEESLDAMVEAALPFPYDMDACVQGPNNKSYLLDRMCEGHNTTEESLDVIAEADIAAPYDLDSYIWARPKQIYRLQALLEGKTDFSYLCDAIIVEYKLGDRLADMAEKIPQFFDLVTPQLPRGAFNSGRDTV